MDYNQLPEDIKRKAFISPGGGEYGWRMSDVEEAIDAGRTVGLACDFGGVQFQFADATCEPYWLVFESSDQLANESWTDYLERSAAEIKSQFRDLCTKTDFLAEAKDWPVIRKKIENEGVNPMDHLVFMLYFFAQDNQTYSFK